jgi:hypothetical protein
LIGGASLVAVPGTFARVDLGPLAPTPQRVRVHSDTLAAPHHRRVERQLRILLPSLGNKLHPRRSPIPGVLCPKLPTLGMDPHTVPFGARERALPSQAFDDRIDDNSLWGMVIGPPSA